MSVPYSCPAAGRKIILRGGLPLVALGAILSVSSWQGSVVRFSLSYLIGFLFVWCVCMGALFFVALHHATGAVWSVVVRRVAEVFVAPLWLLPVLFVPVLLMSRHIYPWLDPGVVAAEPLVKAKTAYLNFPFFVVRTAVYLGLWVLYARYFLRLSIRQDGGKMGPEATQKMRRCSFAFLVVFALTVTFASFDWIMSLQPKWYSTIYGVYVFAGMAVTGLSVVTIAVVWMRHAGMFGELKITEDHLYSLGALLFAFSCFWGYIALSQFLLMWYGNMPGETFWYADRWRQGGWQTSSLLLLCMRFFLPFLAMLSRRAKTNPTRLVCISVLLLLGEVIDLRWLVLPGSAVAGVVFRWSDLGPLLFLAGITMLLVGRFVGKTSVIADGDPLLEKSLAFELKM